MNKKLGVLFDFDGTVYDSLESSYLAVCAVFESCNCTVPTREDFFANCVPPYEEYYSSRGIRLSMEDIRRVYNKAEGQQKYKGFYQDCKPNITKLKEAKFTTGIVSARDHHVLNQYCVEAEMDHHFDHILGGQEDKSEAIIAFCQKYNFSPENVWYIGDLYSDMRDAKRAGCRPIGILRQHVVEKRLREHGAEFFVRDMYEFVSFLCKQLV